MLENQGGAIDADDLAVGKGLGDDRQRFFVLAAIVGRDEDGAVDDQEVGVGGRQALAAWAEAGLRPGEGEEAVGVVIRSAEGAELISHALQLCIMFVAGIVTKDVGDGVV